MLIDALFDKSPLQLRRAHLNNGAGHLKLHKDACQVTHVSQGIPGLGMVIFPEKRKLKARKARYATRQLTSRYKAWKNGEISFAELDASVDGWINHAQHADTWQLRKTVLGRASTTSKDQ